MSCVVLLLAAAALVAVSQAQYPTVTAAGYQNNFGGANYAGLAAYAGFGGQGYGGQGYGGHGGQGYGGQGYGGFFPGKIPYFPALYGPPVPPAPKAQLRGKKSFVIATKDEALSVVIREKMPPKSFSPYQFFGGFNGLGGHGGQGGDHDLGLEMEIEVYSETVSPGQTVFIAITEYDGITDMNVCTSQTSGPVITPGYGASSHGGFPIDAAFAAHSLGAGYGGSASPGSQSPAIALNDAVVAEIKLQPAQVTKINVNSLNSITKLSELAGRGVIACTKLELNFQGKLVCTGVILSCVGLTYQMVPTVI